MTRHAAKAGAFLLAALAGLLAQLPAQQSVVDSPHNLSVSGPGPVRAVSEDRVCVFCHTPHGARTTAPLWNRNDSSALYTPYDSPTITAKPGQPTGSSKLCLSCHDGTIALGDLVSQDSPVAMGGSATMPAGHARIGTDLRDDHPISFSYSQSLGRPQGELATPNSWDPAIKLDSFGMMQCTSCHDPHDNQWDQFLVMDNTRAAMCRECHQMEQFEDTAHANSTSTWNGAGRDPWPHTDHADVASNSCMNCHRSHHAPGREGLLTEADPGTLCLNCHDGSVADTNIAASLRKPYRHPVLETSSSHRAGETPTGRADHVTCVDCHHPHRGIDDDAQPPIVPGLMAGVSGISESGSPVTEADHEYEVCFKCHAEESGRALRSINRQIPQTSIRRQFTIGSPSFHPVVSTGMNPDVPSLVSPLTGQSMIYCTDCHGDDTPTTSGERTGPHGSRFPFLLAREYQTGTQVSESQAAYALCYSCHERSSILANESFPGHRRHIVEERAPCSACHDAHGIDAMLGNSANNAHLMNFDLAVVEPLPGTGLLEYTSTGVRSGTCTLRCHGRDHDDERY